MRNMRKYVYLKRAACTVNVNAVSEAAVEVVECPTVDLRKQLTMTIFCYF